MQSILQTIFNFVIWILIPLILVLIIRFAHSFGHQAEEEKYKTSAKAGFWAGFIFFIIVLVYDVGNFIVNGFPNKELYQGFNIWLTIEMSFVTFISLIVVKIIISRRLSGWAILLMTFAAFYAMFHYLFVREYNQTLLSLILGIVFGSLTYSAVFPSSIREFLLQIKQ